MLPEEENNMKMALTCLIIWLLITVPVYGYVGNNASQTGVVNLSVGTKFSISLNDSNVINFGGVQAGSFTELKTGGQYGAYYNEIVCKSNNVQTWYLKIKVDHDLTSGAGAIPLTNFKWLSGFVSNKNPPYPPGTGTLNHPPGNGYVAFTTSDELVYACGADEKNDLPGGIGIQFSYGLNVPDTQRAGDYTATVTYTMSETL